MTQRSALVDRMHARMAQFQTAYWVEERLLAAWRVMRWVQVIVWCWPC